MRRAKAIALAATALVVAATLAAPAASAKQKTKFSGPINLPIPNAAPTGVFAPIQFGKKGTVKDVNVAVRISHPNVSQLSLYLFKGQRYVTLARGVGGNRNDFGSDTPDCAGAFTVFDGAAPTFIYTGQAPFNGAYRPAESLGLYDGGQSKGTWRLLAVDNAGGTDGILNCWALGLNYKKEK